MSNKEHEPNQSAARMLAELDFPLVGVRAEFMRLQEAFVAGIDPLIGLLFAARSEPTGDMGFVIRQMLVRAINDVVVAFHLICHGYLNPGYNVMRIAYEACDILDLIEQDASQAELWVRSDRPQRDFAPGRVRRQLGTEQDPVYSAFCGLAHPRFDAARLTGYARAASDDPDAMEFVVRLGPFLIDNHPAIGHAAGFLGTTVGRIAGEFGLLANLGAVSVGEYERALGESANAMMGYMAIVSEILIARGQPEAVDLDQTFQTIVAALSEDAENTATSHDQER
jgi:hypothetical protein